MCVCEYVPGEREIQRHQERRKVDGMEPGAPSEYAAELSGY